MTRVGRSSSRTARWRILIADDHPIFRKGLKEILADHFAGATFGEADTAESALRRVCEEEWNVAILDVTMPGRSGVDILKDIKEKRPALPVLMLSMHSEEQYGVRVLREGAAGYLTKMRAPQELVNAVVTVTHGGKYVTPLVAERLLKPVRRGPPHESLSTREYEVMRLIASGRSAKEAAGQLSVSVQTVSTHRARILNKLRLRTTADLIRYAVQNNVVE